MPEPRAVQLTFVFTGRDTAGLFRATRPLLRHRSRNNVFKKLEYVRRFFPEFGREIIRVGLTRVASGMAIPGGHEIWFNPSQISFHAIAHEFVHLLQGRRAGLQIRPLINIIDLNISDNTFFIDVKQGSFRNTIGSQNAVPGCHLPMRPEIR